MILLRYCEHRLQAEHFANILRAAGIRCEVRNTLLSGAIGDIPFLECAPQLWIENQLEERRAHLLIDEAQVPMPGPKWNCECGELLEPQFAACWSCGHLRAL